jgi:hypothetical protein
VNPLNAAPPKKRSQLRRSFMSRKKLDRSWAPGSSHHSLTVFMNAMLANKACSNCGGLSIMGK